MILTQQQLFANEDKVLAPYASKSSQCRGRKHEEIVDPYRTPFQRDRDRIIHCKSFRRLRGKTQVVVAGFGDHYRSRLSHSIEVSQVSRDIARSLGLNEDLCEAIALAHDLGHPPFGHAGEQMMHRLMVPFGESFEHNKHTLRMVEVLESKSLECPGLNLTYETLEGLQKHEPIVHSLEAQVVNMSDSIAYYHHDLDDGLRAGILDYKKLEKELEIWRVSIEDLDIQQTGEALYQHISINRVISLMINDLIENTSEQLMGHNIQQPISDKEHNNLVSFSTRMKGRIDDLGAFLLKNFYKNETVIRQNKRGQEIIEDLFQIYMDRPELMPETKQKALMTQEKHIIIKDYIAGMTDEYALKKWGECMSRTST